LRGRGLRLIEEAIRKQFDLRKNNFWRDQIPGRSLPITWFGDITVKLPRIVTLGANPSPSEYLTKDGSYIGDNFGYPRLYVLPRATTLRDAETYMENICSKVYTAQNNYFSPTSFPLTEWFGSVGTGRLEGFLNGFGASFYISKPGLYHCVHTDLVPFVTRGRFTEIFRENEVKDLFKDGWPQEFLKKVIDFLAPDIVITFGKNTIETLRKEFSVGLPPLKSDCWVEIAYMGGRTMATSVPWAGVQLIAVQEYIPGRNGFTANRTQVFSLGQSCRSLFLP
jgi:hypothetical protein